MEARATHDDEPIDSRGALLAVGLCKHFGSVNAVDRVGFQVRRGEILGLVGPNGAGKTTTLRMVAGILAPDAGSVHVDGVDMLADPLVAKRRIGFLSGDTQLYQRLSTREMLRHFGRLYELDRARLERRIDELCAELQMESFAGRPCGTLSSGQRQRANIARAFLHEPPLLVLDEPTTALDVVSGRFVLGFVRRLREARRGIVLSSHVMSEIEALCDRIVMIHEGRIVDQGTLSELLSRSGQANLEDAFLHHVQVRDA